MGSEESNARIQIFHDDKSAHMQTLIKAYAGYSMEYSTFVWEGMELWSAGCRQVGKVKEGTRPTCSSIVGLELYGIVVLESATIS